MILVINIKEMLEYECIWPIWPGPLGPCTEYICPPSRVGGINWKLIPKQETYSIEHRSLFCAVLRLQRIKMERKKKL
jgi:hypothetical protein